MATLLLAVIYMAFIGLGLPDSLLGSAWPVMHAELGVDVGLAGFASIVATGSTVLSSLVSERMIKRFGTGRVTAVSVLLTAGALMCASFMDRFYVLLLLSVPLGIGGGTVDVALNNFVALHYKASHMNWLHCFWGIGATGGPLIMAAFLARGSWRGAYRTVSLTLVFIAAALILSLPLWARFEKPSPEKRCEKPVPKRELFRLPGAKFACLAFFAYCAFEYSSGLWASTYFVSVKGASADAAAAWASMYYLGITGGRFLSGFAALKLSDRTLIRAGLGCIALGVFALLLPLPGEISAAGLALMGLGSAPIFPCMLDQTPKLFGEKYSEGMISVQMAGAYIGGSLMAPLFGWISPITGISAWPFYLAALFAAVFFATERTERAARKAQ